MVFWARNIEPEKGSPFFRTFDDMVTTTYERIFGTNISGSRGLEAQLYLGLRRIATHATACYLSAESTSTEMLHKLLNTDNVHNPAVAFAVTRYNELVKPEGKLALPLLPQAQKDLSRAIDGAMEERLLASVDNVNKVRLTQLKERDARSWLWVKPNERIGLKFTDPEMVMAMKFILGDDHGLQEENCASCNGAQRIGRCMAHAVACPAGQHRIMRHNAVRNEILAYARTSGLGCRTEVHLEGTSRRPGDIYIDRYTGGRDAFLDVAVKSPMLDQLLAQGVTNAYAVHAAANAHKRNKNQTEAMCNRALKDFIPLVVSTYGVWSKEANGVFSNLAQLIAVKSSLPAKYVLSKFKQRVSFVLLRWNARSILDRCPRHLLPTPGIARRFAM